MTYEHSLHYVLCAHTVLFQLCLTLGDPMDYSPSGSSVHGILQAKITGMGCHAFPPGDLHDLGIRLKSPAFNVLNSGSLVPQRHWRSLYQVLLLLLSRFSRVRLCATPEMAAHQALPSLGLSRQEHWSGLPFPSPMHESEKWKGSRSVVSDSLQPHGLQPTRLLRPWDFPGKSTGVGCHCFLRIKY